MKKRFLLLLTAVTLAGCTSQPEQTQPTTLPQETVTEATEPTQSFYVADTPMERGTAGAVLVYDMGEPVTGISALGENLLVCTGGDQLYLLDRQTMSITAQRELESTIDWNQGSLVITGDCLAYYAGDPGSYIILDSELITLSSAELESSIHPIITSDLSRIFFAETDGIHVLDLATGTSRILRQEYERILSLDGVFFSDGLLRYTRQLSDGTLQDCFINAANGQLYDTAQFQDHLVTWEDRYATVLEQSHPFGTRQYLITGQWDGEDQVLTLGTGWDSVLFPGGGLALIQQKHSVGLVISCYDLETGTLLSQATMPQIYSCFAFGYADDGNIWLWNSDSSQFYCWNMDMTASSGQVSLLSPYHVLTDDAGSTASYLLRARGLSETYQVKISIVDGSNRTQGIDYSGYPDYREEYYGAALDLLEDTLEQLPQGFLKTMAKKTSSGYVQIHLTDNFDPASGRSSDTAQCDLTGKEITISVGMSTDLQAQFLHELYAAIETRIRNRCDDLNSWSRLNPEEFTYGKGSIFSQYAEGDERYFLNEESMETGREDRAQIFLAAMAEGNDALFESAHMQSKLAELCRLIRKAYSLEAEEIFPWERYLAK